MRLDNVYWIGGGSVAGKSTVARRLADRYGLRHYATDDAMADHARLAATRDSPQLRAFLAMDMDERWVNRTPATMLETFHWFRGEGFELIVEDLRRLPPGVVAEGFRLLPRLVKPFAGPGRAVWLLPTPAVRRTRAAWPFLSQTSDPDRARRNLLDRDRLFTDQLALETARLALPVIKVHRTMTEDDVTERVVRVFGL